MVARTRRIGWSLTTATDPLNVDVGTVTIGDRSDANRVVAVAMSLINRNFEGQVDITQSTAAIEA
jgi:hypothetical protein